MDNDYLTILILFISGLGSGLSVGMGSGTAGAIIIPIITIFTGHTIHKAIGTSLLIDCIIGGIAGLVYLKNSNVDVKSGVILIITGIIGAFFGSRFTSMTPESSLNGIIGILLIILGLNFIINGIQKNIEIVESKINFSIIKKNKNLFFILFGIFIGFISGFVGIGVGAIIALILIFVLHYDIHTAIGTSLIIMFFIAGSGALGHVLSNEVIFNFAIFAGFGAVIGGFSGSFFANRINEEILGKFIGVIILIFGIMIIARMLYLGF